MREHRGIALALAALAVAAVVGAGVLLARGSSGTRADQAKLVALLPEAERRPLPELKGETLIPPPARLELSGAHGKPLFVDVWASWCTACREEAPALARLARRYAGAVRFVGIDTQDTRTAARAFVRRYALSFPHLFDPQATLAGKLGVFGVPTVLLVDRRGRIAATIVGKRSEQVLAAYLRLLAAPSIVSPSAGGS